MIKTSLSTGALLSVGGRSLITVLGTVVLHLFISFVLFWLWRQRENNSPPILGLFTGLTCYCNVDSCKSRIVLVNC